MMIMAWIALPSCGLAASDDALPQLLAQLDRVANLYRDTALKFSCVEKIIVTRPRAQPLFYEFEYIYEFSKPSGLVDFRMDKRARHREGEAPSHARLSDYDLPYFLTRGYSWIFLFDRAHQERHRYTVGAETRILGRPALPITLEPLPPFEEDVNDWFGTLWVDAESLQPLRVEAMKRAEHEKEKAFRDAMDSTDPPKADYWDFARVQIEFTQEENGMRFPGKVISTGIQGTVRIRRGKRVAEESTLFTVSQTYTNYRFFGVRTQEEIRGIGLASPSR